ncbi:MAG: hypothetical protein ACI4O7_09200 [Aristaeellaceae bacterium]
MALTEIIFSRDRHRMNWLRPDVPYAEVRAPQWLASEVDTTREGDVWHTVIRLTNTADRPVMTHRHAIGITLPLDNRYERTDLCLTRRAHVHLFCGGQVSWAMGLRMGGEAPHLGLVLTSGSLDSYSVEHNGPLANDRGWMVLHPSADVWQAGETREIAWTIFPHEGKADFFRRLPAYSRYVHAEASRYVLHPGEEGVLSIRPGFAARGVRVDGEALRGEDNVYTLRWRAQEPGEHTFRIEAVQDNGEVIRTWCRVLTHPSPAALAERRVRFLREHQQYRGELRCLQGAYLAYDNEEERPVYTPENDFNGGRERICMGILMAEYLLQGGDDPDGALRASLDAYAAYVLRELVDGDTGVVFNDIGRDKSFKRTYNYPWFMRFFLSLYRLNGQMEHLRLAHRIAIRFYAHEDGVRFYPIEMPLAELDEALTGAQLLAERDGLRAWERLHAQTLLETGVNYPPFEVAFEQSIVGPAADVLLQMYEITGEEQYLRGAEQHLRLLELFNGSQPDYHCHEVALRNWDGYWFGKRRLFGDTLPHYWSGITGNVFLRYARLTGRTDYLRRAEDSLRGVLPLIFPDGRASCACIYPAFTNGCPGNAFDPYANDQDWGLYFSLRAQAALDPRQA